MDEPGCDRCASLDDVQRDELADELLCQLCRDEKCPVCGGELACEADAWRCVTVYGYTIGCGWTCPLDDF